MRIKSGAVDFKGSLYYLHGDQSMPTVYTLSHCYNSFTNSAFVKAAKTFLPYRKKTVDLPNPPTL